LEKGKKIVTGVGIAVAIIAVLAIIGYMAPHPPPTMSLKPPPVITQEKTPEPTREERIKTMYADMPTTVRVREEDWQKLAGYVVDTENTNKTVLVIGSFGAYRGSVQGSDFVSSSIQGEGFAGYNLVCEPKGIYSVSIQGTDSAGKLYVGVAANGKILKQGSSNAEYGVVSIAGTCA